MYKSDGKFDQHMFGAILAFAVVGFAFSVTACGYALYWLFNHLRIV